MAGAQVKQRMRTTFQVDSLHVSSIVSVDFCWTYRPIKVGNLPLLLAATILMGARKHDCSGTSSEFQAVLLAGHACGSVGN